MPRILTRPEDSGPSRGFADLHLARSRAPCAQVSSAHCDPRSRSKPDPRASEPQGPARRMRRGSTEGRQAGAGATYGHPGRDTAGQRRRAASAAPASGEPRGGSWLTAGPGGAGRAERSEAAGTRRGSGSHRALMQEARGAGGAGGGRRPGSPAALCVFSPPRRPLYAPGPTGGW